MLFNGPSPEPTLPWAAAAVPTSDCGISFQIAEKDGVKFITYTHFIDVSWTPSG